MILSPLEENISRSLSHPSESIIRNRESFLISLTIFSYHDKIKHLYTLPSSPVTHVTTLTYLPEECHTTKPGTPEHGTTEHGTPAEQRNTGRTLAE